MPRDAFGRDAHPIASKRGRWPARRYLGLVAAGLAVLASVVLGLSLFGVDVPKWAALAAAVTMIVWHTGLLLTSHRRGDHDRGMDPPDARPEPFGRGALDSAPPERLHPRL